MASYIMQARSSTSGAVISWVTAAPDFAGALYPGPGVPQHIAVSAIQGTPGSIGGGDITGVPEGSATPNAVLQRLGSAAPFFAPLTYDQIAPAYSVSLAGSVSLIEVGATLATPAFTASYARTPAAAVLTDTDGTTPEDVIGTPSAFSSTGSFTKSVPGQYVTWTLTANETGGPSRTATVTTYWAQKIYMGYAVPATLNEAFIEALPQSQLSLGFVGFTSSCGGSERLYYAARSALGTPTFTVGGFAGGFHLAATVSVTNANGFVENYDLWESDSLGLGITNVVVS